MHDPITFDLVMVEFQNSLKTQLQKQTEYFKYLCSDYFNLEELLIISKINLNEIKNIRALQKELYDIHPKDQALNNLSQVFQFTLHFYCISSKKLIQQAQVIQVKTQFLNQVDLFSQKSCSIYCRLNGKSIDVKRTSSNFQQIFELEQINVLSKQVSNLLPKLLYQLHEQTMDDFISLGNVESIKIGIHSLSIIFNQNFFSQVKDQHLLLMVMALFSQQQLELKWKIFVDDFGYHKDE